MNRHNLLLAWHAAMDMSDIDWCIDCIQFKLSHKPRVAVLNWEDDSIINTTLLYFVLVVKQLGFEQADKQYLNQRS